MWKLYYMPKESSLIIFTGIQEPRNISNEENKTLNKDRVRIKDFAIGDLLKWEISVTK